MTYWEKTTFIKDLGDFLDIAQEYELPIDLSSVYNFQGRVEYASGFSVSVSDVVFNIQTKMAGTIPSEVSSVSIYFDYECEFDLQKDFNTHDRIKKDYVFRIKLVGRDGNDKEFVNWFRLDQDEEGEAEHKTSHPYYHFQFGGDELMSIDTGGSLFLSAPRIAHPPMDLFLGIHFIISNFFNKKQYAFVDKLMNDDTYKGIICRAQQRLWDPYFNSYSNGTAHNHFNMGRIFPLYMKPS